MPRAAVDLPLALDRSLAAPLPAQIASAVRTAVHTGALRPGDAMPSTRAFSQRLGVSRGTVIAAYDQLHAETYLVSRPRSGVHVNPALQDRPRLDSDGPAERGGVPAAPPTGSTRVSEPPGAGLPVSSTPPRASRPDGDVVDLRPGHDEIAPLTDGSWRSAWRRAVTSAGATRAAPDPAGAAVLRHAISRHLRLMRGMVVDPDHIVVTAGAREGVGLLLPALAARSGRAGLRVGVEDPGFPGLRRTLARHHVTVVPVPVDGAGVRPERLAALRLDALLVTPNHQFPYGTAMPATRRHELLAWAAQTGTPLVEDDYDSEFRYLGPPLPALVDLADTGQVAHVGTFAAVLSRDIGTGYLVLPDTLIAPVLAARADIGNPVAPVVQRAVATYLDDGGLRRHIQRGRRRLARAQAVVAATMPSLPGAVDTGRLVVIEVSAGRSLDVRERCAREGVLVGDLAHGWSGSDGRRGVVAAYDGLGPDDVARAMGVLAAAMATHPAR